MVIAYLIGSSLAIGTCLSNTCKCYFANPNQPTYAIHVNGTCLSNC